MSTSDIPVSHCPTCNYMMEAASTSDPNAVPHAGAVSICLSCGQILLFNEDLTQRLPDDEEMADIKANAAWAGIQSAQIAIRMRGKIHD